MFKKISVIMLSLIMVLCIFTGCGSESGSNISSGSERVSNESNNSESNSNEAGTDNEKEYVSAEYNVAVLKGPTAIGFIKLWNDSDNNAADNKYNFTAYGMADEITAGIIKDEIDIAAVPCNLASVLYNKTGGKIKIAAINTLGVLYMLSDDESIKSVSDLKGKTIYTTGQGTTPEYTLNYILEKNGLAVGEDVKVEYKSEATEVAAVMSKMEGAVAMLPQPYVTSVLANNEKMKLVLDMTDEWNKVSDGELITGVVIVRNEVLESNPEAFEKFMEEYKLSTEYANNNVDSAAEMVASKDIFKAEVAKKAIPYCNIVFIDGDTMKENVESYLNVLNSANPQSVGGKMPEEEFYYIK